MEKPYYALLQTKGVGESKLEKLIVLIERALKELVQSDDASVVNTAGSESVLPDPGVAHRPANSIPDAENVSLTELTPSVWHHICLCIKRHSLQNYPLGRFSETLDELPRGLWSCPLSDFVDHSIGELKQLKGYGEQRIASVLKVLATTARLVEECPDGTHLGIKVFPARIERISSWINRVLHDDFLPDYSSLCQHFVLPLLRQLECDLGSQPAEMIERRLGVESEPETLQQIAESFDLTRERIRQLTLRAPEVMEVRWPEGKHLLDDFFEKFRSSGDAVRHVELIRRTLDLLFDVEARSGVSRDEVIQAWDTAGRYKETPMSENEILVWLAGSFPELVPSAGLKWIASESLSVEYEGRRLYFSNDELDGFLHRLYDTGCATNVNDLVDADEREQRNLRMKLQRDLRFSEDEDHCFLPTEFYGFTRDSVGWHVSLESETPGKRPKRSFISVDCIVAAALGGLLKAGIVDVTVWGFHRFVNEQLKGLYEARLPDSINAFILGDMVVRQSGKRICAMRRRRLRWDTNENATMIAKGKRGWVGFVVKQLGMPIIIDELSGMLNEHYQDYDAYVIDQLNLDAEEEGETDFGVSMQTGIAHKLPTVLVPDGWSLDKRVDNVSPGVRLSVARAISLLHEGRISISDLAHLPWFVELVERNSYGENFQAPRKNGLVQKHMTEQLSLSLDDYGRERPDETKIESTVAINNTALPEPQKNVDDLLQRFL
ncbi:hypothetical protein CKO51_25625 [Rhodopirellula sp. SM50]|nr:hypothetical protein [Rhodopirellula sp. SM50]PAY16672.1 hypothetical protein CKO51_25625 [Rhodopirellula sp. SM50]